MGLVHTAAFFCLRLLPLPWDIAPLGMWLMTAATHAQSSIWSIAAKLTQTTPAQYYLCLRGGDHGWRDERTAGSPTMLICVAFIISRLQNYDVLVQIAKEGIIHLACREISSKWFPACSFCVFPQVLLYTFFMHSSVHQVALWTYQGCTRCVLVSSSSPTAAPPMRPRKRATTCRAMSAR